MGPAVPFLLNVRDGRAGGAGDGLLGEFDGADGRRPHAGRQKRIAARGGQGSS